MLCVHVGRLLDGNVGSRPAELVKDGDLVLLIDRMLQQRDRDTVRITKVKGHADEGMVREGGVRELDRLGNNAADEAADFGRGRVDFPVIDARRNFAGVCGRWYPVILVLHRFLIAISTPVVNHVERAGTALDPLVWSAGALPKRRRLVHAVRDIVPFCVNQRAFWMVSGSLLLLLQASSAAAWVKRGWERGRPLGAAHLMLEYGQCSSKLQGETRLGWWRPDSAQRWRLWPGSGTQ